MFEALRFWLRKGVDGFRVDVMWLYDQGRRVSRQLPPTRHTRWGRDRASRFLPVYDADRPEIHELVAEMRNVMNIWGSRSDWGNIFAEFRG